jgi:hypothetical protein
LGQRLELLTGVAGIVRAEALGLLPDPAQLAVALLSHTMLEVPPRGFEGGRPALFGSDRSLPCLGDQVAGFGAGGLEQVVKPGLGLDQPFEVPGRGMVLLAEFSRS